MTESVTPTVLYEERGAVALITFNRPTALNSFTRQMHHDLWAALDQAEANPAIRAAVITGAGRGFCAGADLSDFDFTPGPNRVERADPGPIIDQAFNPSTRRLQSLRMPTIAAVNGVAAGAGASLAMCCDIAIAAPAASFIQAFSKIGLIPDAGGSWLLVERLGLARAMALAWESFEQGVDAVKGLSRGKLRVAVVSRNDVIRSGLAQLLDDSSDRTAVVHKAARDGHLGGADVVVYERAGRRVA